MAGAAALVCEMTDKTASGGRPTTATPSATTIGRSIGSDLIERGGRDICIGRDGRLSGPELSAALADGLRAAGVNVIDVGRVATPMLYFAAQHFNTQSGVMLTGSHNPPDYNGLKIVLAGETPSPLNPPAG